MRNFLVFGLTVALTVTAATPNVAFAAPAGGFTDTDSDGINDAVESPACVGDAGESRGGFTDSRGCTGTFLACFEARPDSWYSCGSPESWDRIGLEPTLDEIDYVVDAHGRRYMLHADHMPTWQPTSVGSRTGKWGSCSGSFVLHSGSKAFPVGGRPVSTGLPAQTPPFCHPQVIHVDRTGGGVDSTARASAKKAGDTADRLAVLLDNPETGFEATRKVAQDTAAAVGDEDTGLAATRGDASRAFLEVYNDADEDGDGHADGNGVSGDSRIDTTEDRSRRNTAAIRALSARNFVLEGGWAYVGNGYRTDDWARPILHGPHLSVGYRGTYGDTLTVMVRAYGSPLLVGAAGFTVGGNVGVAVRLPKCPVYFGGSVGGSGWASGVFAPGSQGYAAVTGGGLDVDGLVLVDIPHTPLGVVGAVGLRVHGVKVLSDRDPVLVDFAASAAIQLRL